MRISLSTALLLGLLLALSAGNVFASEAATDLRFDEMLRRPAGPRGVEFSAKLMAAEGQQVRIAGFMVHEDQAKPGRFLLAPVPLEQSDDESSDLPVSVVTVLLDPAQAQRIVHAAHGPITLEGRLEVGRREAADGSVSWLRLQLAPDALAP